MAQDTPSRKLDQYIVRFPDGLRDRIKEAAAANNRSMNAEIISTLETAYPPKTMDVQLLSEFLNSLIGSSAPDGDPEYLANINDMLSRAGMPWTVKSGWDGAVTFYPYPTPKSS